MKFDSENQLCESFTDYAVKLGWMVYPETSDWDLLLEREDGSQCGVQAKLVPNLDVLWQAHRGAIGRTAPDQAAVLVPAAKEPFKDLAFAVGVGVITAFEYPNSEGELVIGFDWTPGAKRTDHRNRCWRPEFVPDAKPGTPHPVRITPWKERAIHCCVILRENGRIRTREFTSQRMNPRDWMEHGWVVRKCQGFYEMKPGAKIPDEDHPEFAAKVKAKLFPAKEAG